MDGAEEENQPTASRPALNGPGQAPLRQPPWPARNVLDLPADSGFTDWEHWAWARILRGMPANMSEYPGRISGDAKESDFFEWISGKPDCSACDPKDISNWPKHRNLSEEFLRLVLFHEPYRSAPERSLVEIECALVAEAIDWQGRSTSGGVQFANCRLEGDLTLYRARVPGLLSLEGSYVVGALKADGLEVSFDLFCNNGFIAKKEIRLIGAQVGGVDRR